MEITHCIRTHRRLRSALFSIWLTLGCTATALGQPLIADVSPSTQHLSGFLQITGSSFGTAGEDMIGNRRAITTTWTDTRIAAYIPESSPLGMVSVQVKDAAERISAPANVEVTLRSAFGRVNWRLRMDALYSTVRPALAPDGAPNAGMIYAVDVFKRLYAVSPDGALRWVAHDAGDKGVSVGSEGIIYTGTNSWVKAYAPRAFIYLDTRVGPDSHIYAANSSGMGVFSLDPTGQLRWVTSEQYARPIVTYSEIAFGPGSLGGQLYFMANGHLRALRQGDGSEVFALPNYGMPVVSPLDGTLHLGTRTYSPDGVLQWNFSLPFNGASSLIPAVSQNGITHLTHNALTLYAIDPGGTGLWSTALPTYSGVLGVDPADALALLQGANTLDHAGFIEARDSLHGARAWYLELLAEEPAVANNWTGRCGFNQYVDSRPAFARFGETVYVQTAIATGNIVPARAFLYAIATDADIPALSTQLRSGDIQLNARTRRSVTTAGGGGGGSFIPPDAGRGICTLTVTGLSKTGYAFDACHGEVRKSIYAG